MQWGGTLAKNSYHVVGLKLLTDLRPHGGVMVDSVETHVVIVDLQQSIRGESVVGDDMFWRPTELH